MREGERALGHDDVACCSTCSVASGRAVVDVMARRGDRHAHRPAIPAAGACNHLAMRLRPWLLAGTMLAVTVVGCGDDDSSRDVTTDLAGTRWTATRLDHEVAVSDAPPTIDFGDDGRITGSTGCNSYQGVYQLDGSSLSIEVGPMTRRACGPPIDAQETAFVQALGSTTGFDLAGDTLTLTDAEGRDLVELTATADELAGSSWIAVSFNNGREAVVSVIEGSELTADFGADGVLSGTGGCNRFSGGYEASEATITVGALAATQMACLEPEGVTEQEQAYLAALQSAATFQRTNDRLELRTSDGALAATFTIAD